MKIWAAVVVSIAGFASLVTGCVAGDDVYAYSCRPTWDGVDQEPVISAVTVNLPEYQFQDYFDECDSGGGNGVRFTAVEGGLDGLEALRAKGCEEVLRDSEYPDMICLFDGLRLYVEVEDPDLWISGME